MNIFGKRPAGPDLAALDKRGLEGQDHHRSMQWGVAKFEGWLKVQGDGQHFVRSDTNIFSAVKAAYLDGLNTGLRDRGD